MESSKKQGSFRSIFFVMLLSMMIAVFWERLDFVRDIVNSVLNPSAGWLLRLNLTIGMLVIVFILSTLMSVVQKYATDQKTLKELKKEQKEMQKEMKTLKEHPEKLMELQKKQLEFLPKMMKLSMRGIVYTSIPLILFFRWFMDYFNSIGDPKFLGFLSWFWFYLITSMIFSNILRKTMDIV